MILHNPTEAPVKDYPIQDPKTKEVYLWSILAGQTLEFPDYAGEYLLEVYRFLQRVMTKAEREAELALKKKIAKGQQFSRVKIVEAPRKIIDKPKTLPGFTTEAVKRNAPTPDQLNPRPVVPAPETPPMRPAPPIPPISPAPQSVPQPVPQPEAQPAPQVAQQPTGGNIAGAPIEAPVAQPQPAPPPQPPANRSAQPGPSSTVTPTGPVRQTPGPSQSQSK